MPRKAKTDNLPTTTMPRKAAATPRPKTKKLPKIFVLDTNIPLHDFMAIRQFADNDLVIPVAVLEELDKFKKGNDNLAFNARAFMREVNLLTDGKTFMKIAAKDGYIHLITLQQAGKKAMNIDEFLRGIRLKSPLKALI